MRDLGVSVVELWPTDSPAGAEPVSAGGLLLQALRQKVQRKSNTKSLGAGRRRLQTITKMGPIGASCAGENGRGFCD